MFNIASEETYEDGQIIFREGGSGNWVYVVLSGSVEIYKTIEGQKYVIEVLQPGEIFGELSFLGGIKRTGTVRAIGESTIGIIDREALDSEYNKLSSDFRVILMAMVKRFEKLTDRAVYLTTRKEEHVEKSLTLTFKSPQSFVQAYARNRGGHGIFIRTDNPLRDGEQFLLNMHLPGLSRPMNIKCEVIWTRKPGIGGDKGQPGMGIKFYKMSHRDNQILKQYTDRVRRGKKRDSKKKIRHAKQPMRASR
ncbi:MAG: cyclic nucleotide-binding domain-containing protein [Candidatus Hodarchaeota archaeon]